MIRFNTNTSSVITFHKLKPTQLLLVTVYIISIILNLQYLWNLTWLKISLNSGNYVITEIIWCSSNWLAQDIFTMKQIFISYNMTGNHLKIRIIECKRRKNLGFIWYLDKRLMALNRNDEIAKILHMFPEIGDAKFKGALWTLKQQLVSKMRVSCGISFLLL